jgi:hypothetical protein
VLVVARDSVDTFELSRRLVKNVLHTIPKSMPVAHDNSIQITFIPFVPSVCFLTFRLSTFYIVDFWIEKVMYLTVSYDGLSLWEMS